MNAAVEVQRGRRDAATALLNPPPISRQESAGGKVKMGNGGGPGSGSGRPRKKLIDSIAPSLSRSPSLPSVLPPLPSMTGSYQTTMLDGQKVLGAGGKARAKKNWEKAERERLEAEAEALVAPLEVTKIEEVIGMDLS